MQRITITQLSEPVRLFLAQVLQSQGVVVEDENGLAQFGVIPYTDASDDVKAAAWEKLRHFQAKTTEAMRSAGVTENDVEQVILEDD
jgi:hypothetical protein